MPNYLSPGVYIEEISSGSKPIAGAGTSTGAFVGIAQKGVIGRAVPVTNWSQFVKEFGGFLPNYYLAYAVYGFFAEGGTSCFVVRTCHYAADGSKTAVASNGLVKDKDWVDTTNMTYSLRVKASSEGTWGDQLIIRIGNASEGSGFQITVYQTAVQDENKLENFDQLTMSTVEDIINDNSKYIRVETSWTGGGTHEIPLIPQSDISLTGGNDGMASLAASDLYGDEAAQTGLHAFDTIDGINIVAIPDAPIGADDVTYQSIISNGLLYCKNRQDCFFVADPPSSINTATAMKTFKNFSSPYGALYYPWVYISDPLSGGQKKLVPPSGVVAGTYAYTDTNRGVHKAPAGVTDGYLDSVNGVAAIVTKTEQELLNPVGINVIRSFPAGICIWGARTTADPKADAEWVYINVRRLITYIERSLYKGTQWVVFEPNDQNLWGNVKRNITAFLTKVWRDGALFGSTPDEAFFVKVDAENNPPELRDLGQLIIDVGVAPVKPAEFVVIRIGQKRSS